MTPRYAAAAVIVLALTAGCVADGKDAAAPAVSVPATSTTALDEIADLSAEWSAWFAATERDTAQVLIAARSGILSAGSGGCVDSLSDLDKAPPTPVAPDLAKRTDAAVDAYRVVFVACAKGDTRATLEAVPAATMAATAALGAIVEAYTSSYATRVTPPVRTG